MKKKKIEILNEDESQLDMTQVGSAYRRMPSSSEDLDILRQRAQELAIVEEKTIIEDSKEAFICFRLGRTEHYGISYKHATEVISVDVIRPVPCVPRFVMGVMNHRGDLLTVLDLKQFFRMAETQLTDIGRIIVVSNDEITVGVYVDEILGGNQFEVTQLSQPLPSNGVKNINHVKGIFNGSVAILDLEALLGDETLMVDSKKNK